MLLVSDLLMKVTGLVLLIFFQFNERYDLSGTFKDVQKVKLKVIGLVRWLN